MQFDYKKIKKIIDRSKFNNLILYFRVNNNGMSNKTLIQSYIIYI